MVSSGSEQPLLMGSHWIVSRQQGCLRCSTQVSILFYTVLSRTRADHLCTVTLLFLPSMLTLATLLSHHVSLYRSQRLERAPRAVVESLPWVQWGIDDQSTGGQTQHQQRGSTSRHEERRDLEEAPPPPRVQQARWTNAWLWSHRVKQWLQYKANVKSDAAVVRSHHFKLKVTPTLILCTTTTTY